MAGDKNQRGARRRRSAESPWFVPGPAIGPTTPSNASVLRPPVKWKRQIRLPPTGRPATLVAPGATAKLRHPKASRGFCQRGGRAAIGPSAAQGHIHTKAQSAAFAGSIAHVIQHRPAQERLIHQAFRRVIDHLGINEGQLHSANAVGLHLFEFAADLRLFDRQPEPPPPHHGLCARRADGRSPPVASQAPSVHSPGATVRRPSKTPRKHAVNRSLFRTMTAGS